MKSLWYFLSGNKVFKSYFYESELSKIQLRLIKFSKECLKIFILFLAVFEILIEDLKKQFKNNCLMNNENLM